MTENKLTSQLTDLIDQFEKAKLKMQEVIGGLSADQFNQRPAEGGWSVGECIDHLVETDIDYTAKIEHGLETVKQKKLFSNGPFKFSWIGKKFIKNVEPPVKRKFTAPKKWTPKSSLDMESVVKKYVDLKNRYIDLLRQSGGLNISKVKLPSPATNLLRFSIYETFNVIAAHQRRHLWQAANVRKSLGI